MSSRNVDVTASWASIRADEGGTTLIARLEADRHGLVLSSAT